MATKRSAAEPESVKSAVRVLDLFEVLARWDSAKTHAELADELRIPKSSLTKLLRTLVSRAYLEYVPEGKTYVLGPAITKLARTSMASEDLVEIAGPILEAVTEATEETSGLNVLKGEQSEVVRAVLSPHRLLMTMRVGDQAPLYATSGGKALLAHLPPEMRRDYLARTKLERLTPKTIVSPAELAKQLDQVAKTGLAYVFEEFHTGIIGMARPILGNSGFPIAAVNVAMPAMRFNRESEAVCKAALERAVKTFRSRLKLGERQS